MLLSDIGYFNWYNPCLLNLYKLNAKKKKKKTRLLIFALELIKNMLFTYILLKQILLQ